MSTLTQPTQTIARWADMPMMPAAGRTSCSVRTRGDCGLSAKTPARRLVYSCRAKRPCDSRNWKAPISTSPLST